ncbi:MAG: HEAT repeat domain-containing protein [Treponema sp.]|jgi:outer membrane protein assembly factor BamB|nr:HEAT repeat domain-containing protein [Treponema sp.]
MNKKGLFFIICLFCLAMNIASQSNQNDASNPASSLAFNDLPYWRLALTGGIVGSPVSQAESVIVVSDAGNIIAVTMQGRRLWDFSARGRLQPYITRSREGTTYVCRSSNQSSGVLFSINRVGRELWQINLREPLIAPVMIGWDNRLFVFTVNQIRCYTASGFSLWSRPLEKVVALKPHKDGEGGFYLVFEDGEFLSVDAFGSAISEKLDSIPRSIVPLSEKRLLFLYTSGVLELLNTENGSREIVRDLGLPAPGYNLAGLNDNAAILLNNGRVSLVSINDQRLLWTGETHLSANDFSGPALETDFFYDERGIYLLTQNGAVAFTEDGSRLWMIQLRGTVSLPNFSNEGILYSGGTNWVLNAYKLEERIRAQRMVMYGPAPEGIYGTGILSQEQWRSYQNYFSEEAMNPMLREIEQALREGQIGEKEKEYAAWLMGVSGSSLGIIQGNSLPGNPAPGYQPPVFVNYRAQAVRLLGYMGSSETVPFLANLFTRDSDPLIKAAAAEALGRIGTDPEGIAFQAFTNAVFPPAPLRDEQALIAVAAATGAMCRFSGPPLAWAGIRILMALSSSDRPSAVRNTAERELKSLL